MVVDSQMDLLVLEVLDNDNAENEWVVHIPHHTSVSANHVITRKRTTYINLTAFVFRLTPIA